MNRIIGWLFCLFGCMGGVLAQEASSVPDDLLHFSDSLKRCYAPDRRVALYDVNFTVSGKKVMLTGVTTSPQAQAALLHYLHQKEYEVLDGIQILPSAEELQGKTFGILNVSVANLRTSPDFSSEMTTQGLLGMPVRVLQHDNWYRIQTPDNYIAWVHRVGVYPVTPMELEAWNAAEKIVVTSHYGFVYSRPDRTSQPVSDVVAGNRLKWEGSRGNYYRVSYPDGRRGYIEKSLAQPERAWRASLQQDATHVLHTAHSLMGVPYLWAGTSSKGVDCSGLVRTVFFMHDVLLPRDASQQAYVGEYVEIASDYSNLQPGDLLFFGRKATSQRKERISHVGIYIGNGRFIHSQGDVHVSSLRCDDELFDAFNLNRMLFARRIIPYINKDKAIQTTPYNPYYQCKLTSFFY